MAGRFKKVYPKIYRKIYIEQGNQLRILIGTIVLLCPECGSSLIGSNGTRNRKGGRIEGFQCKNPKCPWWKNHKYGKQFQISTSKLFKKEILIKLKELYRDLYNGAKNKTIAKKYNLSSSEISKLRDVFEDALKSKHGLDKLVDIPQPDRAIAIDETFFKIAGTSIYVIIATGYKSHKTLGVLVSKSRTAEDIKKVFDEAEKNTKHQITTITLDAWGATIKMAKSLMRKITLIIHKHKTPYDKAVIKQIDYKDTDRVITDIGVKTDVFKRRGTREYKWLVKIESILPKIAKKRGRPKGVKNGQGKKKQKKKKQKRGRKGLFEVFKYGKKGYVKIDPYRKKIYLSKGCLASVEEGLNITFKLFARMSIQNNLAENINSVIKSILKLKGNKTIDSMDGRIRATVIVRNDPDVIEEVEIKRNIRGKFLLDNLKVAELGDMTEREWEIMIVEKME